MTNDFLSIDDFARVLAHLQHFGHALATEVRERMNIDEGVWNKSQAHWFDAIHVDTGNDQPAIALKFAELYSNMSRELTECRPAIDTLGPKAEARVAPSAPPSTPEPPPPADAPASAPQSLKPTSPAIDHKPSPWAMGHVAAPAPSPPARVAPPPVPLPSVQSADETVYVAAVVVDDPLPFTERPADDARAKLARNVADATDLGGMTGEIPAILSDGNETLPFKALTDLGADDDVRQRLTLEQYASLCSELAAYPDRTEHTLRRYGIDEPAMTRLRGAWRRHFKTDRRDKERFDALLARYRTWLTQNR